MNLWKTSMLLNRMCLNEEMRPVSGDWGANDRLWSPRIEIRCFVVQEEFVSIVLIDEEKNIVRKYQPGIFVVLEDDFLRQNLGETNEIVERNDFQRRIELFVDHRSEKQRRFELFDVRVLRFDLIEIVEAETSDRSLKRWFVQARERETSSTSFGASSKLRSFSFSIRSTRILRGKKFTVQCRETTVSRQPNRALPTEADLGQLSTRTRDRSSAPTAVVSQPARFESFYLAWTIRSRETTRNWAKTKRRARHDQPTDSSTRKTRTRRGRSIKLVTARQRSRTARKTTDENDDSSTLTDTFSFLQRSRAEQLSFRLEQTEPTECLFQCWSIKHENYRLTNSRKQYSINFRTKQIITDSRKTISRDFFIQFKGKPFNFLFSLNVT